MTRQQWAQRTDWHTVCARAAARKNYNRWRQMMVHARRDEVWHRLIVGGLDTPGLLRRLADEFGVSRWTIQRDRRALLRSLV